MTVPTVDEIDRIAQLDDPILRNLRITQCYFEISQALVGLNGFTANWCTFATWASKQAGQTIRQEDLRRAVEARFYRSPEITAVLEELARSLRLIGAKLPVRSSKEAIFHALNPLSAFVRAADAVGRGNKKVFEEIGREFARFLPVFQNDDHFDRDKATGFCAALRRGDPPDGQRFLSEAFTAYCEARFHTGKEKAERILLANLCAGYHEQIRLQPEIAEALNAALADVGEAKRKLLELVLPAFYLRARARVLHNRQVLLDRLFDRLIQEMNRLIRQVITDQLMTLQLSSTEVLRLGRDLQGNFSQALEQISNPRLQELLAHIDRTTNCLNQSGAKDWADFADRMHFIADFFRVYQERRHLFDSPFTNEQVATLQSGNRPAGPL